MFLGDVVAKRVQATHTKVHVQHYRNTDEEFNETVMGFQGTVNFSSMLSKISKCDHRLDYTADTVRGLIEKDGREQILVLTHFRVMIDALSDRFVAMGIDHGYYVGGMKQVDLDKSATRRVVLGTYAMAAEGLDIKTLDTLVLASPKSDVVQSVGRVQRSPTAVPLVVDIVDPHPCFRRQYEKRARFYRKNQFEITEIGAKRTLTAAQKAQDKMCLAQENERKAADELQQARDEAKEVENTLAKLECKTDSAKDAKKAAEVRIVELEKVQKRAVAARRVAEKIRLVRTEEQEAKDALAELKRKTNDAKSAKKAAKDRVVELVKAHKRAVAARTTTEKAGVRTPAKTATKSSSGKSTVKAKSLIVSDDGDWA